MLGVVPVADLGTLLACPGTGLGQRRAVVGAARHEPGVQRCEVGHVATKPGALLHILISEALVGTPLAHLRSLEAVLDALLLFVAQPVDLVSGVC